MMRHLVVPLLIALLAPAAAQEAETLQEEHQFPDGLTVPAGSTLVFEDATIELGDVLLVEAGARLEFRGVVEIHAGGTGWLDVRGDWSTADGPHLITGIAGDYRSVLGTDPGGIRIHGNVTLQHVDVRDSGAAFVVADGARLVLKDSGIHDTGIANVAAVGRVELHRVETSGSTWGATGRGEGSERGGTGHCSIVVRDSVLGAAGAPVGVNGCAADISSSRLEGGNIGIDASGAARVLVEDTVVSGYRTRGIELASLPALGGGTLRPHLVADNVTLEPAPGGSAPGTPRSSVGVRANGATALLDDVVASGHSGHGIDAQDSNVSLSGVRLAGNGGHGIASMAGRVTGLEETEFEDNALGAAHVQVRFTLYLAGETPIGAHFHIFDGQGELVHDGHVDSDGLMTADLQAYDGDPVFLGPFRFEVEGHGASLTGQVPRHGGAAVIEVEAAKGAPWVQGLMVGLGVALVAAAFVMPRWRRREAP